MQGHHVAPAAHSTLHLNEPAYRALTTSLWLIATITLFVLGVLMSPTSLAAGLTLVALSMATGVCSTHAMHGGHFSLLHHRHEA